MTYDKRDQFFYSGAQKFKDWPEGVKLGIGFNLNDARYKDHPYYTATINDVTYRISREKAEFWGKKFDLGFGKMPHIIPLNQFEVQYKHSIPYVATHQVDSGRRMKPLFG